MQIIEIQNNIINLEEIQHIEKLMSGIRIYFKHSDNNITIVSDDLTLNNMWNFLIHAAWEENDMVVFDPDEDY